ERIFGAPVQFQFDRSDLIECPPARVRADVPDECAGFHNDAATMPTGARGGQSEAGRDGVRRGGIAVLHALFWHPCRLDLAMLHPPPPATSRAGKLLGIVGASQPV